MTASCTPFWSQATWHPDDWVDNKHPCVLNVSIHLMNYLADTKNLIRIPMLFWSFSKRNLICQECDCQPACHEEYKPKQIRDLIHCMRARREPVQLLASLSMGNILWPDQLVHQAVAWSLVDLLSFQCACLTVAKVLVATWSYRCRWLARLQDYTTWGNLLVDDTAE